VRQQIRSARRPTGFVSPSRPTARAHRSSGRRPGSPIWSSTGRVRSGATGSRDLATATRWSDTTSAAVACPTGRWRASHSRPGWRTWRPSSTPPAWSASPSWASPMAVRRHRLRRPPPERVSHLVLYGTYARGRAHRHRRRLGAATPPRRAGLLGLRRRRPAPRDRHARWPPAGRQGRGVPVAWREEGGTPAIVESIRAGLIFQLHQAVGTELIRERETSFVRRAIRSWRRNPAIEILGDPDADRLPIVALVVHTPHRPRLGAAELQPLPSRRAPAP
jgi:hypothetical protein